MAKKAEVCNELEGYESSHTVLAEGQHSVEILVLRKYGSMPEGEMIYLLHQGVLTVSGDLGFAIYRFPFDAELEGLAFCSIDYFRSHIDCGMPEDVSMHASGLKHAYGQ